MKLLQFRHDCQNLGCANLSCNLCKLCQRRRCDGNFAAKYLAPCDVIEAKCGAQIYMVVVDDSTGQLVQQGLDDTFLQIGLIDGRKFDQLGGSLDVLDSCLLLLNKQGQPLLAHGRSGTYTDDKRIIIPMIRGQAILPDLKITDSSEALLTGRAPPFRLVVRGVRRTGDAVPDMIPAVSEPFVVATARVKGAAKLEIPHLDDHVSKIECVGVQTQKKLEDIRAASVAANIPDLHLPINSVTKVGQFRDLVELAEKSKPLRENLKQVLRLTKGWDYARDHVRRAVDTDVQLRAYCPDGRTDVGLVFKCSAFNLVDINHPMGLLRRKHSAQDANQELVDIIWLPRDLSACPDAVRKILPQASSDWWREGHPGWSFLPLTTGHTPTYEESGQPSRPASSFSFTLKPGPAPGTTPAASQPLPTLLPPTHPPQASAASAVIPAAGEVPGYGVLPAFSPSAIPAPPYPHVRVQQQQLDHQQVAHQVSHQQPQLTHQQLLQQATQQQQPQQLLTHQQLLQQATQQQQPQPHLMLPPQYAPLSPQLQQQPQQQGGGPTPVIPTSAPAVQHLGQAAGGVRGDRGGAAPPTLPTSAVHLVAALQAAPPGLHPGLVAGVPPPPGRGMDGLARGPAAEGTAGMFPGVPLVSPPLGQDGPPAAASGAAHPATAGLSARGPTAAGAAGQAPLPGPTSAAGLASLQGLSLPDMPSMDLFGTQGMAGMDTASQEFPGLPKHDSASPFEDPAFQNLMAMVAANNPAEAGAGQASAPPSKDAKPKRKAETSLDNWVAMHKSLELDISLPPNLAQLSSLFTSLLAGNDMTPELLRELLPHQHLQQKQQQAHVQQQQQQQQGGTPGLVVHQAQRVQMPPNGHPGVAAPRPAVPPGQVTLATLHGQVAPVVHAAASTAAMPAAVVKQEPLPGERPLEVTAHSSQSGERSSGGQPSVGGGQQVPLPGLQQGQQQQDAEPAAAAVSSASQQSSAAATALAGVSLEQLQHMFQAAAKQEIPYEQLEAFLRRHNLLPASQQGSESKDAGSH